MIIGEGSMTKLNKKLTFIILCLFLAATVSIVWASICKFGCCLECNKSAPKPVLTDATGKVFFQLDEAKHELSYKLEVEKLRGAYMAHLHIGSTDKEGPIAVWLYPPHNHNAPNRLIEGEFNGILSQGVIRPEDLNDGITFDDLVKSMKNGKAYVNVHTKKYVRGEIRGQITYKI
jgi:CHRD domain